MRSPSLSRCSDGAHTPYTIKIKSLPCQFQGYLFISVLVNTNSDLIKLIIQSIKNDLASRNPIHVNLALQCIANIGSKEMAEAFGNEIPKLLVSGYGFYAIYRYAKVYINAQLSRR